MLIKDNRHRGSRKQCVAALKKRIFLVIESPLMNVVEAKEGHLGQPVSLLGKEEQQALLSGEVDQRALL